MSSTARNLIWIEPETDLDLVSSYARKAAIDEPLAALLIRRNVDVGEVEHHLHPTLRHYFPDPSSFADMDKAADLVSTAMLSGQKTAVLADYDVDGATSAAQLIRYFRHFGKDLDLYVPDRLKEGYGPSPAAFDELKARGVELVITVDCGAAAEAALQHGYDIGLKIVVVDHHLMGEHIPRCSALVNPNRPDCGSGQGHLAAAGVVFVLLTAMNRLLRESHGYKQGDLPALLDYLDLCALGTLCDMAPLHGVNRAFVLQGLKVYAQNESAGIAALCQVSGRSTPDRITDLTFGLGPQLNAGGRIGDPWLATKLLASTEFLEALPIAETLNRLNTDRKEIEGAILQEARIQARRQLEADPDLPMIVVGQEGWHPGVIGIVAGRLKDEFLRPALVIGWGDNFGELAKGSARSVTGINIGNIISSAAADGLLLSGGGHAMAGGLSMLPDKLGELGSYLTKKVAQIGACPDEPRRIEIEIDVFASALSTDFVQALERAGPYGAGAPKPVLRIKDVAVLDRRLIGKNHIKARLGDGSGHVEAVAWRASDTELWDALAPGNLVDVVGYAEINAWQGRDRVQFEIIDARSKN